MSASVIYESGDIRIDLGRMQLLRAGRAVPLEPKVFDVLRLLVENRERVVTKEELLDTVWAGTFVTQNALTRSIAQLRKSLGDDAHESRYIETAARRGYRFIAPVTVISDGAGVVAEAERGADEAPPAPQEHKRRQSSPGRRIALLVVAAAVILVVGVLLGTLRTAKRETDRTNASKPGSLVRVTSRLGYNAGPSVSPDGARVAYVSDESGSLEIHVTAFARGARDLAITRDGAQNTQPAWSPDGQWLAFHSRKRRGLWIVPATGGTPAQITEFGSQPAWSPDSQTIAFTSYGGGLASQAQLWTVSRDGSNLRELTQLGTPPGGQREPAWSHNGRWLVFSVYIGAWQGSLATVEVATGRTTRLVDELSAYPTIAPGDDAIFYVSDERSGTHRLMRIAVDPATGRASGKPEHVRDLPKQAEGMSIAPDGTIVIGLLESDINLWAIDLDGDRASEPTRLTRASVRSARPDYSNGGRIAFAQVEGGAATTWVMNDDGTNLEPAIVDRNNGAPRWSPDGRRLLVDYDDPEKGEVLAWVELATRRMTPTGIAATGLVSVDVAPDGRSIAYHTSRDGTILNVWIHPLDGGAPRQVTFEPEAGTYPAWSPDGKMLAVEVKRADTTQIGVIPVTGGAVRMLTDVPGQSWPHSWSPDGKWIAFAGERDGVWNVYAVSTGNASIRQLTRFTSAEGYVRYPAWSPNGKRIVFERGIQAAGIWRFEAGAGTH